jgi:hypothetical protein
MSDGVAVVSSTGHFDITRKTRYVLAMAATAAVVTRFASAFAAALKGNLGPFEGFSFSVIFPVVLLTLIFWLGPARSREGVLMRIGTICQLVLIIAAPSVALHLLLGLPVVFLVVELFETRSPTGLRKWVLGMLVTC